jgi:hypothetical protein
MKILLSAAMICLLALRPGLAQAESEAPELPKTEELKGAPEISGDAKAEVEAPSGEPEIKKESVKVVQEKPGRFRWSNFFLGALGGAVLSAGLGIPLGAARSDSGGLDSAKIGLLAGAGAVGGGLLSVLLGATSPLPATPPDMSGLGQGTQTGSVKQLVFTVQF